MPPIRHGNDVVIARRRSHRRTTHRGRYNSLSASDIQLRNLITAAWAAAILRVQQVDKRLHMALLLDLDVEDDDYSWNFYLDTKQADKMF